MKENSMDKENLLGVTEQYMKVHSKMDCRMGKELTPRMEKSTMVSGLTVRKMVKVFYELKTLSTLVNLKTICALVKEPLNF